MGKGFDQREKAGLELSTDLCLEREAVLKDVLIMEGHPRVVGILHLGILTVTQTTFGVEGGRGGEGGGGGEGE